MGNIFETGSPNGNLSREFTSEQQQDKTPERKEKHTAIILFSRFFEPSLPQRITPGLYSHGKKNLQKKNSVPVLLIIIFFLMFKTVSVANK